MQSKTLRSSYPRTLLCILLAIVGTTLAQYGVQYLVSIRSITNNVVIGQPYEVICEVTPDPGVPVSYTWYHNNILIGSSELLRLAALTYPDIGTYVCRAEWASPYSVNGPISTNATVELNLAVSSRREIDLTPPPGSVMVSLPGEIRELHCEFDHSNPRSVAWYFENEPLEMHRSLNSTGRVFRKDTLRVSIVTLNGVETVHGGTYECNVDGAVKQTHVIVRIERGLEVNPEEERLNEGEAAEFHCRAHGQEPNINRMMEWYFRPMGSPNVQPLDLSYSGFQRSDDPITSQTSFVSKAGVVKEDEGEYICRLPSRGLEAKGLLYVQGASRGYRVVITPSSVNVRTNEAIEFECYITDDRGSPVSFAPRFRTRTSGVYFDTDNLGMGRSRFRIPSGLSGMYNGTVVECYADEIREVATAVISLVDFCMPGYRRCRSGQCLPPGQFCDGRYDCDDRSDEDPAFCSDCDPSKKKCEFNQGRQPTSETYMAHWECDGEDDCGNGYDESRCHDRNYALCGNTKFSCESSNYEISMSFVCDKDQDCSYGEDERNCAPPMIQATQNYRYPTRVGDTVTMECRVSGFPPPHVIWRFNWGCLPDEGSRFRVTNEAINCGSPSVTVVSKLTISGIRPGDDGIYNCEGMFGVNRAMSSDYVVVLERQGYP